MVGYSLKYLFPFENPNKAAIFQNTNSKIRGFKIKRDLNIISQLERDYSELRNYAIYFLIDNSEGTTNIYVGQTSEGISRIKTHHSKKIFWSECIVFVTDNNDWDKTTIDYLEYIFIQKLLNSNYILENKDKRSNKPNVNMFDKYDLENTVNEIENMLSCNGVSVTTYSKENDDNVYLASKKRIAKLTVEDGSFILLKGSELRYPPKSSINWSDGGKFYCKYKQKIDELIETERAKEENGIIRLTTNISFSSPAVPACIVSGYMESGWKFWKGLEKLKNEGENGE